MTEREKILESITIVCSSQDVDSEVKEILASSELDLEPLRNTTVIAVENTINGAYLQECTGIKIAHRLLTREPEKKILLYHVMPVEYIRKRIPELDIVLAKPNVRLLEMPFALETMINVFETGKEEIDSELTKNALGYHITSQLDGIWHDLRKAPDPLNPEQGWQAQMVVSGFKRAKEAFPALADKDNAFILNFLNEVASDRKEVRKGENLPGVFCDMEGTLFTNGILNNATLGFLRKQESEGKEVTLWTDGNITELQALLDANAVTYSLCAKRDFAGAIVEMVIDDMDEHSFTGITKIYAKKFTQVHDIVL